MSKEKPNDDPRRQTDWKNTKQTEEPRGRSTKSKSPAARRPIWKNGTKPTRIKEGQEHGCKQTGWRQCAQGSGEETHSVGDQDNGHKDLDQARQNDWRIHGSEEGASQKEIQERPHGALTALMWGNVDQGLLRRRWLSNTSPKGQVLEFGFCDGSLLPCPPRFETKKFQAGLGRAALPLDRDLRQNFVEVSDAGQTSLW